jgi:hypothetical protein
LHLHEKKEKERKNLNSGKKKRGFLIASTRLQKGLPFVQTFVVPPCSCCQRLCGNDV